MKRGEIYLALAPTFDGSARKVRPMLVVQSDYYNQRIKKVLLAPITSNLSRQSDPAHLLIDISTPDGRATGLHQDSLVSCLNLVVLIRSDLQKRIGRLPDALLRQVDDSLRSALGLEVPAP